MPPRGGAVSQPGQNPQMPTSSSQQPGGPPMGAAPAQGGGPMQQGSAVGGVPMGGGGNSNQMQGGQMMPGKYEEKLYQIVFRSHTFRKNI